MFTALSLILHMVITWAENGRETILKVDRAQSELNKLGSVPCETCAATAAGREEPAWRQCLTAACPNGFGQYFKALAKVGIPSAAADDPELMAAIAASLKSDIESEIQTTAVLRDALTKNQAPKNIIGKRLMRLQQILPLMSRAVIKDDGVDLAATRAELANEKPVDVEAAISMVRLNLFDRSAAANGPFSDDFDFFVQTRTAEEIEAAKNQMVTTITSRAAELEKQTGMPSGLWTRGTQRHAEKTLSQASYQAFKDDYDNINSTKAWISSSSLDMQNDAPSFKESLPANLQTKLTDRIAQLKKYRDAAQLGSDDIAKKIALARTTCVAAMDQSRIFLPNAQQTAAFKKKLPEIKEQMVASLTGHMSAESTATLKTSSQKWLPSFPPTLNANRSDLIDDLADNVEASKDGTADLKSALQTNPDVTVAVLALGSGDDDYDPVSNTREVCEKKAFNPIRDAAYVSKDRFLIGAMTVTDPAFGAGVMKHEFGHLASGMFSDGMMSSKSKRWYDNVRSCLQDAKGNAVTVEEDWADFVSALSEDGRLACQFMPDSESSFTLKEENDSHSTDLYRVLRSQLNKGLSLPDICVTGLRAKGQVMASSCGHFASSSH